MTAVAQVLRLAIHATPGARRTEAAGPHGGLLRVRLAAPPVDGKANAELIALLAGHFGCRKQDVTIKAGAGARLKRVTIAD